MSKELFGEASKCRNKKQEAKRKKEIYTGKIGNLLILEMGTWKTFPPPASKKISGIGVLLSQMILISRQFNTELRKKARSSQQVQCNTQFRKKQDLLKIVFFVKWRTTRTSKKNFFFFKLAEI